jgi:hypothetical protein
MDLSQEIYQKYYMAAKNIGLVWTDYDYAVKKGLYEGDDYDFDSEAIPELKEHGRAIREVMTLEVALFVFRRLNGPWGEVIDTINPMINRLIYEYEQKTGFKISTGNEEIKW